MSLRIPLLRALLTMLCSFFLSLVQVAQPYETANLKSIQSIAVCAGSGGSMFKDVDADVYFTGEMTHVCTIFLPTPALKTNNAQHEILAAVGRNRYVVLCMLHSS